jgi:hypothetical protein
MGGEGKGAEGDQGSSVSPHHLYMLQWRPALRVIATPAVFLVIGYMQHFERTETLLPSPPREPLLIGGAIVSVGRL